MLRVEHLEGKGKKYLSCKLILIKQWLLKTVMIISRSAVQHITNTWNGKNMVSIISDATSTLITSYLIITIIKLIIIILLLKSNSFVYATIYIYIHNYISYTYTYINLCAYVHMDGQMFLFCPRFSFSLPRF